MKALFLFFQHLIWGYSDNFHNKKFRRDQIYRVRGRNLLRDIVSHMLVSGFDKDFAR